jgi:hypothetical protein
MAALRTSPRICGIDAGLPFRKIGKQDLLNAAVLTSDEQIPLAGNEVKREEGHGGIVLFCPDHS